MSREVACRHCRARPANRARGLCHACHGTPGVREQYPSTSKFAPRLWCRVCQDEYAAAMAALSPELRGDDP